MLRRYRLILLGLAIGLAAIAPFGFHSLGYEDPQVPVGLSRPIGDFTRAITSNLERSLSEARFTAIERGPDQLVVLYFELWTYPFIGPPELAYLVSRCTQLEALDPMGMGGGLVQGDPATDEELTFLRSDAQGPCLE